MVTGLGEACDPFPTGLLCARVSQRQQLPFVQDLRGQQGGHVVAAPGPAAQACDLCSHTGPCTQKGSTLSLRLCCH